MITVAPARLRAFVAGVLVPLMVLLVTVTPRSAHACGAEPGMESCPCTVVDAEVPQARRLPCCEPEPDARPAPAAVTPDVEPPHGVAVLAPVTSSGPCPRPSLVSLPASWPRGPPDAVPLFLQHCSLLR